MLSLLCIGNFYYELAVMERFICYRIPQIKEHERMDELGKVTVLLIKAVFFNSNGCECEYAVLKCIKEEGSGMYHLVEVRKNPKEVTCDCLFLD